MFKFVESAGKVTETSKMASVDENGSVYDEIGGSEDSESTYSDLADQEITMDVLLPDNTVHKITIPASTPLSDLRTSVCSQFKLLPSKHVVEFVGTKLSLTKRKASLPIGRLDATMIKILTKKASNKPSSVPAAVANTNENTVRLIVKLPRLRQSIIRVNPDIALQNIFTSVCEKLKLDEEKRALVEFHHPAQTDVKLNLKLTLNDYNLREVTLAHKKENVEAAKPPTPVAANPPKPAARKKKAPAPPRPAVNNPSQEHITDMNGDIKQSPAKPTKRRHAPLPPQATQKNVEPDPEPVYAVIRKKKPKEKQAKKTEETPEEKLLEITKQDSAEELVTKSKVEPHEEHEIAASLDATEELDKVLDAESLSSNDGDEPEAATSEEIPLPHKPPRVHHAVHKESDAHSDITNHDETAETAPPAQKVVRSQSKDSEIKIYDVVDDEIKFDDSLAEMDTKSNNSEEVKVVDEVVNSDEDVEKAKESEPKVEVAPPGEKTTDETLVIAAVVAQEQSMMPAVDVVEEEAVTIKEDPSPEEIVISPASYIDPSPLSEIDDLPPPPPSFLDSEDFDSLPPPPQDFSDTTSSQVEKIVITETSSLPSPVYDVSSHAEKKESQSTSDKENSFDLHIGESFGIPDVAIDDHKPIKSPPPVKPKPATAPKPKSLAEFIKDHNENEIKPISQPPTTNKSDEELVKIQKEIKRMKMRKSAKETERSDQWKKLKEGQRNTWHPGSTANSFTFVPKKSNATMTHEDYKEASKPVIDFSKRGEIKAIPNGVPTEKAEKKEIPPPQQPTITDTAPKARSTTLPSYYKKFLGANAFSASKTAGR